MAESSLDIRTVPQTASALAQAGRPGQPIRGRSARLVEHESLALVGLHSLADPPPAEPGNIELPQKTGELRGNDPSVLCLRPREWLLLSDTTAADELLDRAREAIGSGHFVAHDRSDGLAAFRLSGHGAPWLLGKLSGLDFVGGWADGPHGAQTRMGDVAVIVICREPENGGAAFDLLVDRSLAVYLWDLLAASMPHADELAESFGESA